MKFSTKPFEIEAIQFTGDNLLEVQDFVGVLEDGDTFGFRMIKDRRKEWPADEPVAKVYDYLQSEWIPVKMNDWIIKGMKGEFYPCNSEVFEAKYTLSLSERTKNLQGNSDAQDWASVWMDYMRTKPHIAFDEGVMLCWFANAIMAGYDEARNRDDVFRNCEVNMCPIEGWHTDGDHDELAGQIGRDYGLDPEAHDDLMAQNYEEDPEKCPKCGKPLTCEWHPVAGQCENAPQTDEQPTDGDSVLLDPERASDGLLAVLKDEADRATQEASGGVVESIRKETGIDE